MEFNDKLKSLRRKKGISLQALANAIYVSRSAVAKWENGLGLPSDDSLEALCTYFQIPTEYFQTQDPESVIVRKNKRIYAMHLQRIALLALIIIALILILPNTRTGMKFVVTLFHMPMEDHAQECLVNSNHGQFFNFTVHAFPDSGAVFYENTSWGYRGIFYSADGAPAGFHGVEMVFYRCGKNNYYWSDDSGDNWMHAEHIIGNWFWYEMHF